ncbi:hypothetical protein DNC80_14355 [Flavobacterium sp. SOK18b]|uniref:hypothetical protein n=1 Tax=Flavobacterium sp. SOK18b TaxID=797900 RepID=UPI0015F8CADF|nr:hypothetical protein [Flavobacterium sp. SOK18b]MBB1194849.1 hypothetical protein [Flavobacterium sp. SOK18b]
MNNLENNKKDFQELQNKLVNLCWASDSVKRELFTDPKKFLNVAGAPIPENTKVVVEETATETPAKIVGDTLYLYIYSKPDFQDVELSDKELEIVSGGAEASGSWICSYSWCGDLVINL